MARTLPWLRKPHTVRAEAKRDRPVKRQRVQDPASDQEDDLNSTGVSTPRRRAIARPGESLVTLSWLLLAKMVNSADSIDLSAASTPR